MNIGHCRQIFATFIGCLQILFFSWNCAWANANFLELQSQNTTFPNRPITYNEASIMVSIVNIGGLLGNILSLWLLDKLGQKNAISILSLANIISCWLILLARNIYSLYAARLIVGLAIGNAGILVPVFIAEISSDSIRGILNAMVFLSHSIGNTVGLLIATLAPDYRKQAIYLFIVPTIFSVGFSFVAETPIYLWKKNQTEQAKSSLNFYQGRELRSEFDKFITQSNTNEADSAIQKKDFFGTQSARKALVISIVMTAITNVCGLVVLLTYTAAIFKETSSMVMSPVKSALLFAFTALIANFLTMTIVDWFGRKLLLIISLLATALGFFVISFHHLYRDRFPNTEWIPFAVLILTIFIACSGSLPIPHIIKVEILPPKIRNVMITVLHLLYWTMSAIILSTYSYLLLIIELHGCFIIFGILCLVSTLFVVIYLPETKGRSYRSIETLLNK